MNDQGSTTNKNNKSSEKIYSEAVEVLAGGISRNTIYNYPYPHYVSHAKGCYVTDVEGVSRIDFANNMASLIHGHSHPAIIEAVTNRLQGGTAYTLATEEEVSFAKLLKQRVPGFEKIRFVNSGTEAVMAVIKAARAFTGKYKIAKAEGAYHGIYDFTEVSQTANPSNWGPIDKPNSVPVVYGTPPSVLNDVFIFPYNDTERTLAILDQHADEIACVLIDPIPHRVGLVKGTDEFVEALYNWTRKNGALLVFDEVVTFRTNYSGAQENYSVKPDLTALGKIIGGGFPIGALAGRTDVMNVLDPRLSKILFPHSGTFSANPISLTAGYVAMQMFDRQAVESINNLTQKAVEQISEAIKIADVPVCITGAGSMFRFHLGVNPPSSYREAYQNADVSKLFKEIIDYLFYKENIMMINTCACMFSTAITQKEVDILTEAMKNAFIELKPKIDQLIPK